LRFNPGMRSAYPRRGLILGAASALAAPMLRAQAQGADSPEADAVPDDSPPSAEIGVPVRPLPPAPERHLWIVNNAGEEAAIAYRAGETYLPLPMARLQHVFRDIREDTLGPLPPLLLDMLSLLQERWRFERPLRLVSGFRTLRTNMSLEHAAPGSLHLHGLAADISIPGVPALEVAIAALEVSRRFGFMGVGFYRQFVHVDVGPSRAWTSFDG
jgi:uncharacterized protein YcbK (DUF882 family)